MAAPKFHSASATINNSGALVVSFDERGLGNENVDYTLTADATATYACINRGGHHPKAENKETVSSSETGQASLEPKNGRVVASISVGPPLAGDFQCTSSTGQPQILVLASVSYSNIVLTDTTNNVSRPLGDVSRTFFQV